MTKLRREPPDGLFILPTPKPLRIVASGTLFLTYTLCIPCHPAPSTVIRAHSVVKTRGGSASTVLSLLAQFSGVEAVLVAPLGGNDEGKMILRDLEKEGVITHYCKVWKGTGVPSAWVLHSAEDNTRTVVNHNPLPDITHEEFVSILGPLLVPENYLHISPPIASPTLSTSQSSLSPPPPSQSTPRVSFSGARPPAILTNPNSPAPFDWLHFEGRSVKTTLNNITGLDGLARERKWRSHCVFSVDVGRKGRQGVEALIPHADVVFLNKHYAQANSSHHTTTPRTFLLSLTAIAPPHALLVAHWGSEGAAVLSLPTKEYFQSSGWVEERKNVTQVTSTIREGQSNGKRVGEAADDDVAEFQSVRSGSEFWANGRSRTPSSSAFTSGRTNSTSDHSGADHSAGLQSGGRGQRHQYSNTTEEDDDNDNDSQGTEVPEGQDDDGEGVVDEVGAQDAFVAGMIYALSRRMVPGSPYTPSSVGENVSLNSLKAERGRWRLDECLRFATELAGRKARRRNWEGLADEMARAGWFDM